MTALLIFVSLSLGQTSEQADTDHPDVEALERRIDEQIDRVDVLINILESHTSGQHAHPLSECPTLADPEAMDLVEWSYAENLAEDSQPEWEDIEHLEELAEEYSIDDPAELLQEEGPPLPAAPRAPIGPRGPVPAP